MKKEKLTDKQQKFVEEYLIDLNATQAAKRAGYSEKTAFRSGSHNLRTPKIAAILKKAMKKREKRTEITQDRVLKEYGRIAFLDPRTFFDSDGKLIPIHELPDEAAAALGGMDIVKKTNGKGDLEDLIKIKFVDKIKALDSIGRHLGMFEKDKNSGDSVIFHNINFGKKAID